MPADAGLDQEDVQTVSGHRVYPAIFLLAQTLLALADAGQVANASLADRS